MNTSKHRELSSFLKHEDLITELFAASLFLPVALCIDGLTDFYFEEVKNHGRPGVLSWGDLAGCSAKLIIMITLCMIGVFALGFAFQAFRDDKVKFVFSLVASLAFTFFILFINGKSSIAMQAGLAGSLFWAGFPLLLLDWREWDRRPDVFRSLVLWSLPIIACFLYILPA